MATHETEGTEPRYAPWLPVLIAVACLVGTLGSWMAVRGSLERELEARVGHAADRLRYDVVGQIAVRVQAVARFAERRTAARDDLEMRELDVAQYLRDFRSLRAIGVLPQGRAESWWYRGEHPPAAETWGGPLAELAAHARLRRGPLLGPLLAAEGSILLPVAIATDDASGAIDVFAIFDARGLASEIARPQSGLGYPLALSIGGREVYRDAAGSSRVSAAKRQIDAYGTTWELETWPHATVVMGGEPLETLILLGGLVVSALFPVAVALGQLAHRRQAVAAEALSRLEWEGVKRRRVESERAGLFAASHEILGVTDLKGRIRLINEGLERILGFSSDEALGRELGDYLHRDDVEATFGDLDRIARGGALVRCEARCVRRDGSLRWIEWTIVPDLDAGLLYSAGRDVTEARTARDELVRSNADLEQFAYVASHDLQEPLRTISSYVQLLARRYRDALDDDARDFIDFAVDGARRMQQLIDDLLTFSRLGSRAREPVVTDLEDVLRSVEGGLWAAIRECGATITRGPLPRILGDASQLAQLLQNLVGNALKFRGEAPPRIHLSAREEDRGHVVAVEDFGIGIEVRHFERIFGVFQRLHPRERYPGTGIGLAVCKRIVERHGGRIWVESEPGHTTFSFWLPGGTADSREEEADVRAAA